MKDERAMEQAIRKGSARPRRVGMILAALALAVALMLLYVWKGWHTHTLAADAERLRTERQHLLDEQARLRARIVALSSVERIKEVATTRLGLVDPTAPPIDVPAIAPMGPRDSLEAIRATGMERAEDRQKQGSRASGR